MTKRKLSQGLKKAQSRLLNINSKKILNSVILLYIVLFASFADLLYLVSTGAHSNVIIFILIAYVTSIFSKNMTVILITSLAITNIYHLGRSVVLKEGFEEGSNDEDDTESKDEDTESKDEDDESKGEDDDESKDEDTESKGEDDDESKESNSKNVEKLPEEYKKTLAQLSDPETLKTIEGIKSLEPLIGKMERVIGMFN